MSIPILLRQKEVAASLGVTDQTLRSWIAAGHFPAGRRLGPKRRIWTEDQVTEWLTSKPLDKDRETR